MNAPSITPILPHHVGVNIANQLVGGNPNLAFTWQPPAGAVVVIFIIRVSPDRYIYIYENEGIRQILQLVMAYKQLQETCKDEQFVLYPCVFGDLQIDRHKAETHETIPELIHAIGQGHLSNNQVVVLLRDATRSAHEVTDFNDFRALLKLFHSNIDVHYVRNLLSDSGRVKEAQYNHDESILAESAVASRNNVTYTLERLQQDEDIQYDIDEAALELKDSMSNEVIHSIIKGAARGDSLPNDNFLREKMMELHEKISAGTLTPDDAAEQFFDIINDPGNSHLLQYNDDHLSATSICLSRTSPGSYPKRIFDDIDKCDVISEELGNTAGLAPQSQTAHNIAAIKHEMDNIDAISSMILVHDEGQARTRKFKPANIKAFALIAFNRSNIKVLALSTLVRSFTDLPEGHLYLAILKKANVKLLLSYDYGFDITDQAVAEHERLLRREVIHGSLREALEELEMEEMSAIVKSFELDDVEKQLLFDLLSGFNGSMDKISYVQPKHYEAAKTLKISDKSEDITSLDELTVLAQDMSLEDDSGMSSQLSAEHTSPPPGHLSTVVARTFIPGLKVTAASLAAQEDDHGGKMPVRRVSAEERLSSHLRCEQVTTDNATLPRPHQSNRRVNERDHTSSTDQQPMKKTKHTTDNA